MNCNHNNPIKPDIVPVLDFSMEEVLYARDNGQILSMDIEITEACNFACIYCYRYNSNGPQPIGNDELTAQQIIDLLTSAKNDYGLRRVCLLGGEPLLPAVRDKYIAVLKACNELGIEHITFTNGDGIDNETVDLLYEMGASVCIKLNAMTAKVHDQLVGSHGSFEHTMKIFKLLKEKGFGKGARQLAFETVITKTNISHIVDMWSWARREGIVPYVEILTEQGRSSSRKESLSVPNEELEVIFNQLLEIDQKEHGLNWDVIPPIAGGHKCLRYYMSIYVRSNGDICPCVGVDSSMGNFPKNSIAEILNSEVGQKTRHIEKYVKGKCKDCDLSDNCYGCRGAAYQAGDLFGEDPVCWRNVSKK